MPNSGHITTQTLVLPKKVSSTLNYPEIPRRSTS